MSKIERGEMAKLMTAHPDEHERVPWLTRIAMHLIKRMPSDEVEAALHCCNQANFRPMLSEEDVKLVVETVASKVCALCRQQPRLQDSQVCIRCRRKLDGDRS